MRRRNRSAHGHAIGRRRRMGLQVLTQVFVGDCAVALAADSPYLGTLEIAGNDREFTRYQDRKYRLVNFPVRPSRTIPIEDCTQASDIVGKSAPVGTQGCNRSRIDHLHHDSGRRPWPVGGMNQNPRLQAVMIRIVMLLSEQQQCRLCGLLNYFAFGDLAVGTNVKDLSDQRVVSSGFANPRTPRVARGEENECEYRRKT